MLLTKEHVCRIIYFCKYGFFCVCKYRKNMNLTDWRIPAKRIIIVR